jgi:hypothetical protein
MSSVTTIRDDANCRLLFPIQFSDYTGISTTPNLVTIEAKRNSSLFFCFFSLFYCFFSLYFRFTSIFSLNFRLFYLRFRFRFLVFRIEVNHVKSGFFFASKRNKIFASISNFASEAKVRAHPRTNNSHITDPPCFSLYNTV